MTLQELKLINKALRAFPNSPEQLEIRKQIEKLRTKTNASPSGRVFITN